MAAREDRTVLIGLESKLFNLVAKGATSVQWAEWLRVPLEHAVAEGDKDLALSLLKAGANGGPGWKGCGGRTLLDAAAEGGNEEALSMVLLENGALKDLNAISGGKSMTPLHRSIARGHAGAARVLMLAGANAKVLDSRNRNVLHYTIEGGHFHLAGDVMLAGADHDAHDVHGDTPLHLAAAHDDVTFVCALLHRRASVNMRNSKGMHPLHIAIEHDHIMVVEALLNAGADPNARCGEGAQCSPLQFACTSLSMTRTLLKYGADVNSSDNDGYTALHSAAKSGEPGVIDALVEAGADPEAPSAAIAYGDGPPIEGLMPLHLATHHLNLASMVVLLRKGANVHAENRQGLTSLHVLCMLSPVMADSATAADLLLRWGADETATDTDGKTSAELIDRDTDLDGRLGKMLANAPADRTWRRRGILVMCRPRADDVPGDDRKGKTDTLLCLGEGVQPDVAAAGRRQEIGRVLARVVELEDDAVFRMIVRFL